MYLIQEKNKQHLNQNISATTFINSCLPNLKANHFSDLLYRRDVGQIRILCGNWYSRWE